MHRSQFLTAVSFFNQKILINRVWNFNLTITRIFCTQIVHLLKSPVASFSMLKNSSARTFFFKFKQYMLDLLKSPVASFSMLKNSSARLSPEKYFITYSYFVYFLFILYYRMHQNLRRVLVLSNMFYKNS